MFKNVLFAVAAFAFLTQINPILANEAEDLLKKLEAAVDEGIVKANETLEAAKADVTAAAQSIEGVAQNAMAGTEEDFKNELDALKQKASDAGVNIDDCLGDDETALVTLPTTSTNSMVDCDANEINKAFKFAQDALNKAAAAVSDVENIRQEIKDCGSGLKAVKCLAKLALKIEEEITTLPTTIEVDAAASAAQITNLKSEVQACADTALNQFEDNGKALLEKIGACVATKIIT